MPESLVLGSAVAMNQETKVELCHIVNTCKFTKTVQNFHANNHKLDTEKRQTNLSLAFTTLHFHLIFPISLVVA